MNAAHPPFESYSATLRYLNGLGMLRMNPSLANMASVLATMGLQRPSFAVAQVVGTNGKGSTSSMLASISAAHGCKTGLFTSPHFVSPRERIRIDGRMISEEAWLSHADRVMRCGGGILSYFEFIMAVAVSFFAEEGVAIAVMEAGLGGTWDATTALAADLTVITPIALDHQELLGGTLEAVARDKAGAIRPGVPVCSARQQPVAWREITAAATEKGAPLSSCEGVRLPKALENGSLPMLLKGDFQKENAKLAVLAWRQLSAVLARRGFFAGQYNGAAVPPFEVLGHENEIITVGLSKAWIPGRMQRAPARLCSETGGTAGAPSLSNSPGSPGISDVLNWPPLVLDGAHNEHGIAALGASLAREGVAPLAVVFACLEDKKPERMISHLRALATGPIFVPPIKDNPRAMDSTVLAAKIGVNAVAASSLAEAVRMAVASMKERMPEVFSGNDVRHPLLVCGSLYLLGEFYELRPDLLEVPS